MNLNNSDLDDTDMSLLPVKNILLIACGSFNPPTPMHFRMFEIARDHFHEIGTHHVLGGIVSPANDAYAKAGLIASTHRCAMIKGILQTSDWIRLSDWESKQDNWTRTRISLQYHQNYANSYINDINGTVNEMVPDWLPNNIKQTTGNVQVKLLCGADLLESFAVPGLWAEEDIQAILGQHGIVVVSRSGSNPEKFIFESDLLTKYKNNITIVTNWVPNDVSSTMARRLISRNFSVKYLLDDAVIEYIKKFGLYGSNQTKYILTPNQNELILSTTQYLNETYQNKLNVTNYRYDDMDETDHKTKKHSQSINSSQTYKTNQGLRPKILCCGRDTLTNAKTLLNPGRAVQIVTDTSGSHTIDHEDEVGESSISTINLPKTVIGDDKFYSLGMNHELAYLSDNHLDCIAGSNGVEINECEDSFETSNEPSLPSTSDRSQNDLIKFVFTSHGIRVISDKEYVV